VVHRETILPMHI